MDEGQLEGQVGSISDELAPPPAPEAADAVADFDGGHPQDTELPEVQPEPIAPAEPQFAQTPLQEPANPRAPEPVAHDSEKHAPRRSTVREKVSFGTSSAPVTESSAPIVHSAPVPGPDASPAPEAETSDNQPRKAGWWSRRFGGGE
jgi:ribonuclease E